MDFPEAEALKLLAKAHGKVREATRSVDHNEDVEEKTTTRALAPGDRIEWERADLTVQHGVVDFLQTYPGEVWAFCTLPDRRWSAVNVKYIRKVESTV
jgi:hypothetical protein